MNEEVAASFRVGAHVADTMLGLLPILDDYEFQLVVKKFFSSTFMNRINFDKVGEDTDRREVPRLAFLHSFEELLHGLGRIRTVR